MPTQRIPRMMDGVRGRRALIVLWCLILGGCAAVTNEPTDDAITAAAVPPAVDDTATPEPPYFAPAAVRTDATERSIEEPPIAAEPLEPEPTPPSGSPPNIASGSELAAVVPAASAAEEFEPAPSLVPSPPTVEGLDFSSLVTRLRKTNAISLRTKVAVKHESDDLLERFRVYHTQHGIVTLADLRSSYDSLLHRLHSLLEDADPPLARDIDRSRAAIWEVLADPSKFSASHLMAGA